MQERPKDRQTKKVTERQRKKDWKRERDTSFVKTQPIFAPTNVLPRGKSFFKQTA